MLLFGNKQIDTIPDKELLAKHAQGDPRAFPELVSRHRDRMWAVALRTIGDQEEAADALQDAFLSAYRAAGKFRGESAVTTWLHRIVVNACLDRLRRRTARPTVAFPDDDVLDAVAPKNADPTSAHELSLDVADALRQIPYEQRAALVLVDMMGYTVEDAARVLEVPPGTIKSRCARGRARLVPLLRHLRNRTDGNNVGPSNVDSQVPAVPRQAGPSVLEEGGSAS
ncbi:RNA polymerase sigma factor SigM [Actinocorallia sp. B10E7]|uniref:RNA polymerase sigma factor SigM n=1 Tax=Actinocorallia sp. B10E7 TaxID=3153558 RepID=UPI00325F7F83